MAYNYQEKTFSTKTTGSEDFDSLAYSRVGLSGYSYPDNASYPGVAIPLGAPLQESYTYSTNLGTSGGLDQYTYSTASAAAAAVGGSNASTVNQIASDLLQLNTANSANSRLSVQNNAVTTSTYESGTAGSYLSSTEAAILRSSAPIELNETEEITVLGQRGIWANRAEVAAWRGVMPIEQYQINSDPNPEVITKRTTQNITYIQELAIRYLRPPTPPPPGEIVITQEVNTLIPPAPPLVIRQQPPRPATPEPLVIREAPPKPPPQVGRKVITISGKRLPPAPRKVVIERLAPLPSKPQSVLIERWLPYSQVKRRVIFQKSNQVDPIVVKPRNVIIQWEAPQVQVRKEFKYLGIIRANPYEYVQRYGASLKTARELPDFVLEIKPPQGVILAAEHQYNSTYELEGDIQALRLIDLDREGLSEYKSLLQRLGITGSNLATSASQSNAYGYSNSYSTNFATTFDNASSAINEIFSQLDRDHNGRITIDEAEKVLLRLNSRLGRRYGEDEVNQFFRELDHNRDGVIDLTEFRSAFERLV